jgi:small glutamine-rich tetratricopeptide repeat-containing protein alpha
MSEKQQRLVLSIIEFLNQSIKDGTVREEDKESLEVAGTFTFLRFLVPFIIHQSLSSPVQCIGEAFGVDSTDQEQVARLSVKPATLQTIFDVFLKTKDKISSTAQAASSASPTTPGPPSAEDKAAADKLKQEGNALMSSKQYDKAIDAYTEAIKRDPSNPVYYSNRAAAHSSKSDHLTAAVDAEKAIELDPKFVKGYSRLGCRAASFPIGISLLTSLRTDTPATASATTLQLQLRTVVASN